MSKCGIYKGANKEAHLDVKITLSHVAVFKNFKKAEQWLERYHVPTGA